MNFILENGKINKTTCVKITTKIFKEYGIKKINNIQEI